MSTVKRYSVAGKETGTIDLPEATFGAPSRPDVIFDALRSFHANQRQGTAMTKTRSLVAGGGKKPWKQKGTGRARHGSIRSPIWVGGGTVFGPKPRDYSYQIPRKMRRLAIRSVLSERAREGQVFVVDDLSFDVPKTKVVGELFKSLSLGKKKVLVIGGEPNVSLWRSVRNIAGARCAPAGQISVYDVLATEAVVILSGALALLEEESGE
jgi:large subunit ribosomal protein L4